MAKRLLRLAACAIAVAGTAPELTGLLVGWPVINLVLFLGYYWAGFQGIGVIPFALYLVVYFTHQTLLKSSFDAILLLYDELAKFKTILRYLETYPYGNNIHLKRLCARS